MILLDTSVLVSSLTGAKLHANQFHRVLDTNEHVLLTTLVLYEWLRGSRRPEEIETQERLFPRELAIPFGPAEAALSAQLYRSVPRPRGREFDLGIAACAILREAKLWTLNRDDFKDIPGLTLASF